MYFKTLGYNTLSQAGTMASDLKIGHYLKVPPRAVFLNQMLGTLIGCIFNYIVNHVCIFIYVYCIFLIIFYKLECGQFSTRSITKSYRKQHLEWFDTTSKGLYKKVIIYLND